MKMLKSAAVAASVMAFLVAAPNAGAVTIDVTGLSYEWNNVVGGLNISNNGLQNTTNTASLRWGGNVADNLKSGYDFTGEGVPFSVDDNVLFNLGEFTHINHIVPTGSAITSADFQVNVAFNGESSNFDFRFLHDETTNSCTGANCADDLVDVVSLVSSDTFTLGGQLLTLSIVGFSTDGGNTIVDQFRSVEGGSNSADLYAKFTAPIPLPAAGWMFLTGLAGLGWVGRRRIKKKAALAAA